MTTSLAFAQDAPVTKVVPNLDDAPVFNVYSKIVVYPKGIEKPPPGYSPTLKGKAVLAVVKIEGTVLGEIYGNPLKGTAKDEADEMSGSADGSNVIEFMKRESAERAEMTHEIATLRIKAPSKFGTPWIAHSVYFPRGEHSVTFAFVAEESNFNRLLPLFDAMLFTEEFIQRQPLPSQQ